MKRVEFRIIYIHFLIFYIDKSNIKKNLSILVGADNRYPIVNHTLQVCNRFFDLITIIYNCPSEYMHLYEFNKYQNVHVIHIDGFIGEFESCIQAMFDNSPKNEWLLRLDADETPSAQLINELDGLIERADKMGECVGRIPYVEHFYDDSSLISYRTNPVDLNKIPKDWDELQTKPWFCAPRLIKNTDVYITTNFGGHETVWYKNIDSNSKILYSPNFIIHHKSSLALNQSKLYHLYTTPWQHIDFSDWKRIRDSIEYKTLREFQDKWDVYTSNELSLKFYYNDELFISDLKEMLNSFSKSELNSFKWMSDIKDCLSTETKFYKCKDKLCCDYENII